MTRTTWKLLTAGALAALVLLLWWWSAARRGGEADSPRAAGAGEEAGIDVASLVDRARLERVDLRRADRAAITGHVREPDGRAVAGATVCAGSPAGGLSSREREARTCTTSAADGSYAIEGLLPVPQFVHASAPGHVPGGYRAGTGPRARRLVPLRAGQTTGEIDVVLRPGGVELKGIVRDLSGGELEGALVSASFAYARSGPDGGFSLWVEPGEVFLEAHADGYASGWMQGVAPGQLFEIALTPESVLVGRVVRASDGTPLADAEVTALKHMESYDRAFTDANGQFRIEGLKPGAYRLEAFHDEAYGAAAESAVLGLGETSQPIVILAHPAYLVEGTVVIAGGGSCEQGWVRLDDKAAGTRGAHLEADGVAHIRGVLPGSYEVQVDCDDFVAQPPYPVVEVSEAPVRGLRWEVAPGQAIRGKVVLSKGTGVGGVHVHVEPLPDPAAPRGQATRAWSEPTAEDGGFEAVGLLPGRYRVTTSSSRYPPPEPPLELVLPPGQDLEDIRIELPATGELRGTVKDSEGRAVKGVEVALRGEREEAPTTRTRDDGSFTLAHVAAGSYRVTALSESTPLQAPGTTDDDLQGVPVTLAAGEVREVQLVVKSQRGRIAGRVVDSAGGPLSDAFVEATRERDGAAASPGEALRDSRWGSFAGSETRKLTDQDGRFELTGLAEGSYTLLAQRRGGGEGSAQHVAVGSEVQIRIADTASIAGTVRIQGGGTPQQFTVSLYDAATGWRTTDEFFRTGGAFRFPEVPGGDYQVTVEAAEGASSARTSVAEGGRGEVQIELLPLVTVRGRVIDALSGAPVPAMQVRFRARGQVHFFTMSDNVDPRQVTDAEGRFEVDKVAAGAGEAMVVPHNFTDTGYGWTSISIQVPASGASTVDLPPLKIVKRRGGEGDKPGDLGVGVRPPPPETEPADVRLVVAMVRPGGPAMQAGVQVGDEIVSVDGQDVTGANAYLFPTLSAVPAGTTVRLGLARGATVEVTAAAMQ